MNNWVLFEVTTFTDATCDTTSGSGTITCDSSSTIRVGQNVDGAGVPASSFVKAVNSAGSVTSFTLGNPQTGAIGYAYASNSNTTLVFRYKKPTVMFAYPLHNLNALLMTTDSAIDLYFRNPIQPTEAVSDDKITLTTKGGEAGTFMHKLLDMFDKTTLSGKKIFISKDAFSNVIDVAHTAGA
jgi:hypothetical protein